MEDNIFGEYPKVERPIKEIIKQSRHGVLLDLMETLPFTPNKIDMMFRASDVQEKDPQYIDICKKENVMPYSSMKLSYNDTDDKFKPAIELKDSKTTILDDYLKGGRIHKIELSVYGYNANRGLENLLSKTYSDIASVGYDTQTASFEAEIGDSSYNSKKIRVEYNKEDEEAMKFIGIDSTKDVYRFKRWFNTINTKL